MILKNPPRDKSITHRALILAAIARGTSMISHPLLSQDIQATLNCLKQLGIVIKRFGRRLVVIQGNPDAFHQANNLTLNCLNSGTTLRHFIALLANSNGNIVFKGDSSLESRPMQRIVEPLQKMGAKIHYLKKGTTTAPLKILKSKKIQGGTIQLKVASAQVKSALLLYGLLNKKNILLKGKIQSRNHTENFLQFLGVKLKHNSKTISLSGTYEIPSFAIDIPADPSSTLFYIFLFQHLKRQSSKLILPNHYYNITRCYSWDLLIKSGFELSFIPNNKTPSIEPQGSLIFKVNHQKKKGFKLHRKYSSFVIDEIPLLMAWALFLNEPSEFESLEELTHKESNRLLEVKKIFACFNLENHVLIEKSKTTIYPLKDLNLKTAATYKSHDHRMVMLYHCLLMIFQQKKSLTKKEKEIISVSNPQWESDLLKIFS